MYGEWYRTNEGPGEEDIDGSKNSDMYLAQDTRLYSVDATCISVLGVGLNHGVLIANIKYRNLVSKSSY